MGEYLEEGDGEYLERKIGGYLDKRDVWISIEGRRVGI